MNVINELENVLREEQDLLLKGNFQGLERLVKRKSQLAEWLAKNRPELPTEQVRRLAQRANQNEALLESARRGLQAAMAQLKQAAEFGEQTTYSKSGERRPLSRSPASITQKI